MLLDLGLRYLNLTLLFTAVGILFRVSGMWSNNHNHAVAKILRCIRPLAFFMNAPHIVTLYSTLYTECFYFAFYFSTFTVLLFLGIGLMQIIN